MRGLKKQEQIAIEAVARRSSAACAKWSDSLGTYIKVDGKQVAVDIATLRQHCPGQGKSPKPHLRFDKVVIGLMGRLRVTLGETVPDGMTVLLTVTAPIRLASKTAGALEGKIQNLLRPGSAGRDKKDTIHGNRVRIRLLKNGSGRAPKMIGFVHNSDTDPLLLLNMTCELLGLLTAEAGNRAATVAPKSADGRWLVVISARGSSCLGAYRYIYSQLRMATGYKKVLMVFSDGRIEALTE